MLKRKRDRVSVQLFQNIYKIRQRSSVIILMGTEYTGKAFFAVKRYPQQQTYIHTLYKVLMRLLSAELPTS